MGQRRGDERKDERKREKGGERGGKGNRKAWREQRGGRNERSESWAAGEGTEGSKEGEERER